MERLTLTNGESVLVDAIDFNATTYLFKIGNRDITNLIRRADKNYYFPEFDPLRDNIRLSTGNATTAQLETSTGRIFLEQITTDPLDAPLDAFDAAVDKVIGSSGIQTVLIVGFIGLGLLLVVKLKA